MGKQIRKAARNAQKKRFVTTSPKSVLQETVSATNAAANDEIPVGKETETCPHLDNGINWKKYSTRIVSAESLGCEDCRKQGKINKPEAIWVCLECAHFSCGGISLPTIPNSHAAQHAKEFHHSLAFQSANPKLRWCFPCNALIPVQNFAKNEEKDSLSEFVTLLKLHSASLSVARVGIRDRWLERGSVGSDIHLVNTLSNRFEKPGDYMVRGLMNLGNTCFFNSVLQNLLSLDKLRDYLLGLDGLVGPLTMSLKNLFIETSQSAGVRCVVNPSSLLSCVRTKSPQFKGFQQQDSHELLRCLLDGLSTEESREIKRESTFVDNIFGGQISSTVSCLECGHASVVYEPCLDLSLPLPVKKVPPKTTKKQKPPPKMRGRFWENNKRKSRSAFYQSVANTSTSEPKMEIEENTTSSSDSILSESPINDSGPLNGIKHDETIPISDDLASLLEFTGQDTLVTHDDTITTHDDTPISKDHDSASLLEFNDHDTLVTHDDTITTLDDPIPISKDHDLASLLESNDHDTLVTHDDTITTHDDTITISDTHDLAAKSSSLVFNGHDTTTDLGDDIVTEHDVVSTVEANMHVDSIDTDETWLDNVEHDLFTDEDMLSHSQDSSVIQYFGPGNKGRLAYDTRHKLSDFDALECLYDDPDVYAGPTMRHELSDFDAFYDDPRVYAGPTMRHMYDDPRVYAGPTMRHMYDDPRVYAGRTMRHKPSNFDAFGGLYDDDPRVYAGPNGFRRSGYMATSYSDSDADEVDDTDSSLSVEKCLTHFTTPELLTKTEHAWQCEHCAKSLLNQKTRLKNETQKPVINEHENGTSNASSDSAVDHLLPNSVSDPNDQGTKNGDLAVHNRKSDQSTENGDLALHNGKSDQSTDNGDMALHNGKSDQSTENGDLALHNEKTDQSAENGDLALHNEKSDQSTENGDLALDNGKSDGIEDMESCSDNGPAEKFENKNGQEGESGSIEDEEVDSKNVNVARDASKRILISRAPQVLTIHLKRFSQDARGRLSKINGHVNFGETLDLKPYMDPSCCKDRETYKYQLVGVVEHSGTMRSGHYVAYVKRGAKGNAGEDEKESSTWYHASDAYVREVSLEEVLKCDAYILFYEEM